MAKISSWHFRHLLQVVWLKKACKRGDHGHPRTPLATPLVNMSIKSQLFTLCYQYVHKSDSVRS